uniref:tetratricopeptide repeat protein n=1 Tax=Agathobacter sp. TaxID=2021311 RepID=UPI00405624E7
MICYNCGSEAGTNMNCTACNADLSVFQKVIRISNVYYNDGLQKAEVRNLSGAIISLKRSLRFNKYNIEARNLLGLVYYEMGEVVDALSEWVISKSYRPNDNAANRYLDELQKKRNQLDSANQTIKKYNQALMYCRQDSRDLAIIQLKKVLSLNPKLVKAHQLLALLYLQENKLEQAKKTLRNAGKIDVNNTITLRYLKEVNVRLKEKGNKKKKQPDDLISYQSGNETIIMPKRFQDTSFGITMAYVVIGLIVGAAVTGFLIVPGVQAKAKQEANQQIVAANDTITSNQQIIARLETRIEELQTHITELEQKEQDPQQIESYEALINAYVANEAKDYVAAGNSLESVHVSHLSENMVTIYNTLSESVMEKYHRQLYTSGYSNYSGGNYAAAVEELAKVVAANPAYKDGYASYYLAQAYRKNGDIESAQQHYRYVIENYPNTERARTARNYIVEE